MEGLRNFSLNIACINVNSMNLSTLGTGCIKTYTKIEGITAKKSDVIFISDMRLGDKGDRAAQLFNLTRNGNYKLYYNSTRDSRGVGIAVKRGVSH